MTTKALAEFYNNLAEIELLVKQQNIYNYAIEQRKKFLLERNREIMTND